MKEVLPQYSCIGSRAFEDNKAVYTESSFYYNFIAFSYNVYIFLHILDSHL